MQNLLASHYGRRGILKKIVEGSDSEEAIASSASMLVVPMYDTASLNRCGLTQQQTPDIRELAS